MCIFTGAKTIAKVPSTRSTILGKTKKKKLNFTFYYVYDFYAIKVFDGKSRGTLEQKICNRGRMFQT